MAVLGDLARKLRPYVERVPALANTYREIRDRFPNRFGKAVETALGFRFAGHPTMTNGSFEPDETRFLEKELEHADVFIDVGANIGYFTCLARSRGVHTIAIEPLESNLRVLYQNITANEWADHVEVFPVALAEGPGLVEIFGTSTGASLIPGWAGATNASRVVPVSTLDTLVSDRFAGQRVLVKIDVEGVEHLVLRGAPKLLAQKARWLVEVCLTENQARVNPHFREVFDAFWNAGYRAETVEERRQVSEADVNEWLATGKRTFGSYNIVFIPTES